MKKIILSLCSLCVGMVVLHSCLNNPFPPLTNPLDSYLTIENATYQDGTFPSATINSKISGITYNQKALQGGSNIFTIVTDKTYKKFFVGIKNVSGYLIYIPEVPTTRAEGDNSYTIPVVFSPDLITDVTMLISGEDENGDITEPYEAEVTFVDSEYESGELNINLTFSNAKDVDLHLFMPNGEHIYYGARGGTVETVDGRTISYGLDHDSNAGCNIDNLNNENIYIPAELIQYGTYRVVVDMYKNCNTSTSTNWSIVARDKDELISPTSGRNPATGVYPVGAGDGDMTTVMEFTINADTPQGAPRIKANTFVPTPLSDMDEMKLEEEKFRMEYNN